jgi:cellulose synthase/poly-beta-1,6-N-acetylglucosamine synthase-like glycosyltransferase/peptidoglycan/xylan/chitin deacetylase (PgdA/CDA1 family)
VYGTSTPTKYVVLTFDDGPAGKATEDILKVLNEYDTPATFFLVGQNVMQHTDLVKRMYDDGYTIGNHTFSHASDVHVSKARIEYELGQTNSLIEAVTGHSAVLYRPPYLLDMKPFEVTPQAGEKPVWSWVYGAGYVPVGVDLDSDDWSVDSKEQAISEVRAALEAKKTRYYGIDQHIFLLHDEPQTAAALPEILDIIKSYGYEVVPLPQVLGLTKEQVMPTSPYGFNEVATLWVMRVSGWVEPILMFFIIFVTLVAIVRIVLSLWFKVEQYRTPLKSDRLLPRYNGRVSVLIPAWDESDNVRATIRSVLANTRQPDEIIVIDDGSKDDTLAHARAMQAEFPSIVRAITKENGGKASALNYGLTYATGDVVVAIDGDTVLDTGCIDAIVRPFAQDRVGATAGKIVPANANTLLEKYQYLEYLVGQNIDKEVISWLGAVNVVPGAVGAWRRELIFAAGGYSEDTLVEDQDLTLAVLGLNYAVVYVPDAIAYTEVPTALHSFYFQRFRWTYGTFQCLWKYRRYLMGEEALRLGWFSLPYAFLFNIVMPVITLALNISIVIGVAMGVMNPALSFLLIFTLFDILYAYAAFLQEPKASRRFVALVPIQRLAYLFLYSIIMFLVLLKLVDGSPTRWNKLKRTGSAERFFREKMGGNPLTVVS